MKIWPQSEQSCSVSDEGDVLPCNVILSKTSLSDRLSRTCENTSKGEEFKGLVEIEV